MAEHVHGMPILVAHGDADWVVPVELVWYSKAMGAGARDWFADAPQVSKGSVLRELVHPDCWPALENMVAAMIG